jgi:hypothetical protein
MRFLGEGLMLITVRYKGLVEEFEMPDATLFEMWKNWVKNKPEKGKKDHLYGWLSQPPDFFRGNDIRGQLVEVQFRNVVKIELPMD